MEVSRRFITKEQIKPIIQGAAFLGSGGGGGIDDANMIAEYIFSQVPQICVKDIDEIAAGDKGAVVALMGAPKALKEMKDFTAANRAFKLLEKVKNEQFSYCLPVEIGAVNSLIPMLVAAQSGISIINGDGAGRAVPQLETTTFAMAGISPSPAGLTNCITDKFPQYEISINLDNVKLPPEKSLADLMEEAARDMIKQDNFGQVGGLSLYYTPQAKLNEAVIPNTLMLAYGIGERIVTGGKEGKAAEAVAQWLDANRVRYCRFGQGEVTEVKISSQGGFDIGIVKIKDESGNILTINYENENLFAYLNEDTAKIWAMAPDLICYLQADKALTNVEIAQGQKVTVFGLPANMKMRNRFITDRFMKILQTLKIYNGRYIPIELLHAGG